MLTEQETMDKLHKTAEEFAKAANQMKSGNWNLGEVVKPSINGSQHEYFIFRTKLDKFLGKT